MLYKISGEIEKGGDEEQTVFGTRYIEINTNLEKLREITTKFANTTSTTNPEKLVSYINKNTGLQAEIHNKPVVHEISAKQVGYRGEKQGETTGNVELFKGNCPDCGWEGKLKTNCRSQSEGETKRHNNETGHEAKPEKVQ